MRITLSSGRPAVRRRVCRRARCQGLGGCFDPPRAALRPRRKCPRCPRWHSNTSDDGYLPARPCAQNLTSMHPPKLTKTRRGRAELLRSELQSVTDLPLDVEDDLEDALAFELDDDDLAGITAPHPALPGELAV